MSKLAAFDRTLASQADKAYAALRIFAGALMSFHGMQKILGILSDYQPEIFSQMWIGGVIELVGGILVAFGFFTRISAFLLSGTMAVAYFQFHWKFQFDEAFFPVVNKGELAVLYCFVFLFIACRGPGSMSLEKR